MHIVPVYSRKDNVISFCVRFTDYEKELLTKLCEYYKMNRGEIVRMLIRKESESCVIKNNISTEK